MSVTNVFFSINVEHSRIKDNMTEQKRRERTIREENRI